MPLYEYKCQSCGEVFEVIQKFSDTPLSLHEKCGGQVERLISTSALQFKGSGWYITDYAKKDSTSAGKSETADKADAKADSKSDAKTETKPESKTESKTETKTATASPPAPGDSKT